MTISRTKNSRVDVDQLKLAAVGRWAEILTSLGGIGQQLLDGKAHACPRCGGIDRFRFIDEDAGACFCNQCFSEKNGDGLAAIGWATGKSFPETLKIVGE